MKRLLALLGCCALVSAASRAGTIQLQPQAVADLSRTPPALRVHIANHGAEAARSVRVEVTLGDSVIRSDPVVSIGAGKTAAFTLPLAGLPRSPGFYQAAIRMRYSDRLGFPYSAVSLADVSLGDVLPADWIVGTLSPVSAAGRRTLSLTIDPIEERQIPLTARLILPDELVCGEPERRIVLLPGVPVKVDFEIETREARIGSRYLVFAVLSYEADGTNQAASASAMVTVDEPQIAVSRRYGMWFAGALALLGLLVLIRTGMNRVALRNGTGPRLNRIVEIGALLAATLFILFNLSPANLLIDTTTVGGDTPAHNYLASHLQQQLFGHGRVISWANGWWGGFPMFQFYFCLPYVLTAVLGVVLPFNIAFKWVSVLGMLALPAAAYVSGRLMRLPRPAPVILSVLMAPFLFVGTHTMWGVNVASTLAGMISNSLSFAIMLVAIGSVYRDAEDGRFRVRSVLLLALVIASHFFTCVMAGVTLAVAPLLQPRGRRWRALLVLVGEGVLAALLMAWWLVPLAAKSDYSMEFGTDWQLTLWKNFPGYAAGLIPFAAAALVLAVRRRIPAVWLFAWMTVSGTALFMAGARLSPVFVNIRLWPFIFFGLVALGSIGLGLLLERARLVHLWTAAFAVAVLAGVAGSEDTARRTGRGAMRDWAEWNYEGLERKADWKAFSDLVLPLKGTAGRLANDLSSDNESLGSSRIFELAPHLIGKPVLEGGLVNSAIGAMFAYYIQSETSSHCAGYPPMVVPATFNPTNAAKHLELFNVKQFIARWPAAQAALGASPQWKRLGASGGWELFELQTHDGRYVSVLDAAPDAVVTPRWKDTALEWFYTIRAVDRPVVLLDPDEAGDPPPGAAVVPEAEFKRRLAAMRKGGGETVSKTAPRKGAGVVAEQVSDDGISFDTEAIGKPHLIKMSYYPNWKVRGADRVWKVTPDFMLVYPQQRHVDIYYGSVWSDVLGRILAMTGLCLAGLAWWRGPRPVTGRLLGRARLLKALDATVGFLLCWTAGWLRYALRRQTDAPPDPAAGQIRRVLVIRPGGMGDMVLLLPALNALRARFPGVSLDLVCEKRNHDILRLAGFGDGVYLYDAAPFRLVRRLWRGGYDAAIDTEQFHYFSALMALFSRAPVRIGFKINPGRNLLYTHLVTYDLDGYEGSQFMRLFEPLGVAGQEPVVEGCLSAEGQPLPPEAAAVLRAGGSFVAIHAGSTTRYKLWAPENFAELVRRLAGDGKTGIVLIGGKDDRVMAAEVQRQAGLAPIRKPASCNSALHMPVQTVSSSGGASSESPPPQKIPDRWSGDRFVSLAGELTLAQTAAVIRDASLFVGGDSGLAHVAAALGTPTVVFFGPSDSRKWGARGDKHRIVRRDLACAPCCIFGYHKLCRSVACLQQITADDVFAACTSSCSPAKGAGAL